MNRKSLIITYISLFVLMTSLFFECTKISQAFRMCLLVVFGYFLYKINKEDNTKDDFKEFNYLYVATIFVFAIYAAGFRSVLYFDILLKLTVATLLGLLISLIYVERNVFVSRPKIVVKKVVKEDLKELVKEAKALVRAEAVIKKVLKKPKAVKKTTKKKVVKKAKNSTVKRKVVTKAKKKVIKKKTTKKTTKKKVVKKAKNSTVKRKIVKKK